MKFKRKVLIIILIIFILISLQLLYLRKNNISLITKNMPKNLTENNITTIDITNLENSTELNHEHIFKTQFNDTTHWNECTICHNKKEIITHNLSTTWSLGTESCNFDNSYTQTCSCGYSIEGHKPCTWDGKTYYTNSAVYGHSKYCSKCKKEIEFSYYFNGKFFEAYPNTNNTIDNTLGMLYSRCTSSNGTILDCNHPGTCKICKYTYTKGNHSLIVDKASNKLFCLICNDEFGTVKNTISNNGTSPSTYTITSKLSLKNGCSIAKLGNLNCSKTNIFETNTQTLVSTNTVQTTAKFSASTKSPYSTAAFLQLNINGINCRTCITPTIDLYPDFTSPKISNISTGTSSNWAKIKEIIINGTENYCDTVKIKILENNNENVIFEGKAVVNNKSFSISCTPELEADINGKTLKCIVIDACNNSTEQTFEINKIDCIPPTPKSESNINENWEKEKLFTFNCTDTGIGNVQIAFNNENEYALANSNGINFTRTYKFIGDVYSPKQAIVLYKDGLGNVSSKEITLNKIDNTSPTITKASIHNNLITITGNDIHEGIGEGSGITQYRYAISTEQLNTTEQNNLSFINVDSSTIEKDTTGNDSFLIENIATIKYIYIQAIDLVGNISNTFEFKVPQLNLTSSVDLTSSNNKGGIILDWSTYDISDKYFVIYRKEKNSTDWNIIVTLEDKLNSNHFIDTSANDTNTPNIPDININKNNSNNDININLASSDNGSKYSYYIECYSAKENTLINISNITN